MCIVKTNIGPQSIGHEKKKCFQHFQRKQSFLSALVHNYYKQESKIDDKIAANKLIHGKCRFPLCALMSTHYIFCRVLGLLPSRYVISIACSLIKRVNLPMESTVG